MRSNENCIFMILITYEDRQLTKSFLGSVMSMTVLNHYKLKLKTRKVLQSYDPAVQLFAGQVLDFRRAFQTTSYHSQILSNMFSAIFSIVFAMVLVSVESSTVQSAVEVAMRCTKKGWQAEMDALASGPVTEEEILEDACIYLRSIYISPVYISLSCGLFFLSSKEEEQQKIKTFDGVGTYSQRTRRGENDTWADCVGLTMRKCMLLSEKLIKEGKSMDFVSATTEYINCCKKADKYKCPAKMLDHYIHTMDVYYQHLD
ncbi:unnamed protein product [Porites lobata]|uniref:Uncharacterized protein n=1 Tax=Porites lobata TaxID=104759 RepID=A0ABN8SE72_9CNID|nr:unnamed protein product [Porites lobata]